MNKLKMLSVALMCVCGLNLMSCVDDEESQSVENVRNAKAEALKAKAALEKANAEAVLLLAQADAAIKNAEAAYKQALADKEQALADQQKVAAEIAKAKLEMEIELAKLRAQAALDAAKKDMLENAASYSSDLFNRYNTAVEEVYNYTLQKITAQKSLLDAKYKLENFDVLIANIANSYKWQIALSEAKIAEYQKMSDAGNEEIQAAYMAAAAEAVRLSAEWTAASKAASFARENMQAAETVLNNTAYSKAVDVFDGYSGGAVSSESETYTAEEEGEAADGTEFKKKVSFSYLLPIDEREVMICINKQEDIVKAAKAAFVDVDTNYQKLKVKVDSAYFKYDTAKVEANKATYLEAYYNAKTAAENYYTANNYEQKLETQEAEEEILGELKAAKEALATYTTTYQAAVDAVKKEADAYAKANLTLVIKDYEERIATAREGALRNLATGDSVADLIAKEETKIKEYNNKLSQISYDNYTEEEWEVLVAQYEAEIAYLEVLIAKAQADADYYKSLIEAEAGKA